MINYLVIGLIALINDCAGYYKIQSVHDTNRYLDVQDNAHGVEFRTSRSNDRQKWNINDKAGDYVEFVNQGSNLDGVCCDGNFVNTCSWPTCWCNCDRAKYLSGHNTAINLYEQTNDGDEEWSFESISGQNYYRIKRKGSSNGYLYIDNSNDAKRGGSRSDNKDKFYLLEDGTTITSYTYDAKVVYGEFLNDKNMNNNEGNNYFMESLMSNIYQYVVMILLIINLCCWCHYHLQSKYKKSHKVDWN